MCHHLFILQPYGLRLSAALNDRASVAPGSHHLGYLLKAYAAPCRLPTGLGGQRFFFLQHVTPHALAGLHGATVLAAHHLLHLRGWRVWCCSGGCMDIREMSVRPPWSAISCPQHLAIVCFVPTPSPPLGGYPCITLVQCCCAWGPVSACHQGLVWCSGSHAL